MSLSITFFFSRINSQVPIFHVWLVYGIIPIISLANPREEYQGTFARAFCREWPMKAKFRQGTMGDRCSIANIELKSPCYKMLSVVFGEIGNWFLSRWNLDVAFYRGGVGPPSLASYQWSHLWGPYKYQISRSKNPTLYKMQRRLQKCLVIY